MKRPVIATVMLATFLTLSAVAQKPGTPEAQLGAIISQAEVEGKYEAAIPAYKKFIAENGKNRALAAKAQYHLAVAYQKLGNPEARKVYEQVVKDYGNEAIAADARGRLAALSPAASVELIERRICSNCGDSLGSFSKDGRLLAFSGRVDGQAYGLVVRDIASGEETQITDDGRVAIYPVLSPDTKQIAYSDLTSEKSQLKVVANKHGATPKVLTSSTEYMTLHAAGWTPDGKSILVAAMMRVDRTWMLAWVSASDGSVRLLKPLGWRSFGQPVVSPDGRYIAYAASVSDRLGGRGQTVGSRDAPNSGGVHIYVLAADGSSERELVKGASINQSPVWMPDGKSLLFVSDRSGSFGLWSVSLQDGLLKQVKADIGNIESSVVSPSGVYLNLRRFSGNEQFVVKRGADIEEILSGAQPAWAPDSKSIAYIRNKENKANPLPRNQSPMAALVVYSLSTRDEKRLIPDTELGAAIGSPAWSHDGKVLWQLIQDSHGVRLLYRADIKTGIFTRVAENVVGNNSMFAALSSDDKTIYMIDQSPGQVRTCLMVPITSIDVNSGQQRQIVSLPRPRRFILSSDQKTLYSTVCREDANTGDTPRNKAIVSVDLATGVQKQILSLQNPDELTIFDLALSPDGRTLVFTVETGTSAQRNSHSRLYRVGVDGDGYRKLADVPSETGVSWSRNGSILFLEPESWEPINIPSNGNDPEMRSVPRCVNCSLSPDGLRVFKPRGDYFELWALENVSSSLASRK